MVGGDKRFFVKVIFGWNENLFRREPIHSLDGQWVFSAHFDSLQKMSNTCKTAAKYPKIVSNMLCSKSAKKILQLIVPSVSYSNHSGAESCQRSDKVLVELKTFVKSPVLRGRLIWNGTSRVNSCCLAVATIVKTCHFGNAEKACHQLNWF